jgi:hypothetical protein
MVKHQRRSHQRGLHGNEILDDCTSESDIGELPGTPTQTAMSWGVVPSQQLPEGSMMHRAASFADFDGQQMNQFNMQHFQHRHSVTGDVSDYTIQTHPAMIQRAHSSSHQPFYVVEQGNPAIATMNTNMSPSFHVPRGQMERPTVEISYNTQGMTTPATSSPGFSPTTGQSPAMAEGLYTHAPHAATYALHNAAAVAQQPMVQYTNQISQQHPNQATNDQYPSPHAEADQWYQYQAPVEVATIGQLPAYGSGIYDLYGGPKIEFDDPSMQLPSSRIETM